MVFSSVVFLFYFLPAFLLLYWLAPARLKNAALILGSLIFYAWGEVKFIPVLLALSLLDYFSARMMDKYRAFLAKRRLFLLAGVGANLAVLVYFKYAAFAWRSIGGLFGGWPALEILLPLGVSFTTFQAVGYLADVYKGEIESEKSFYNYLTFRLMFPQIISGPIVRYGALQESLAARSMNRQTFAVGMQRFLVGLAKKVLLADPLSGLWQQVLATPAGEGSVLLYWLGLLAYMLKVYFDFSGYSDMAIGLAKIIGFDFADNFDFPYVSRSITEFWRRWHISLGGWFRDYVYIPLGGNRRGEVIQLRNIVVVWALTGLWHGAAWNFVLWGLYFAVILLFEKFVLMRFWERVPAVLQHIYALILIAFGWLIFAADTFTEVNFGGYAAGLIGLGGVPLYNNLAVFQLLQYGLLLLAGCYVSTGHVTRVLAWLQNTRRGWLWGVAAACYAVVFLLCVAGIVAGDYNPFFYFRF